MHSFKMISPSGRKKKKGGQQPNAGGLIILSNCMQHFEGSPSAAEHLKEDPCIIYEPIFIMYQN